MLNNSEIKSYLLKIRKFNLNMLEHCLKKYQESEEQQWKDMYWENAQLFAGHSKELKRKLDELK